MVSAFIKFSEAKRKDILAANPGIGFGDIGRKLGEAWRALSAEEKALYVGSPLKTRKVRKNKGTHRVKENKNIPVYGEANIMKVRKTRSNKGTHRVKKEEPVEEVMKVRKTRSNKGTHRVKPNNKTRKISAYAMFVKDHQAEVKAQNPGASFGDISRKIAAMWKETKGAQ